MSAAILNRPSVGPSHRVLGALAAGVLLLAAGLTGCASSDPNPAPAPAPAPGASPDAGGSGSSDDNRFGVSLEATATVIGRTLQGVSGHSISGSTLTINFSDGTADFDGVMACMSVGGLMNEGETLVLSYPDGPAEC